MSTPKPAVPVLNAAHAFATSLLLCVPFSEGSGVPGILLGAAGIAAGAPSTANWTGTPPAWSTNSAGICVHNDGSEAMPLQLGTDGSGAWLPTGDCTVAWIYGASTTFADSCSDTVYWFKGATSGTGAFAALFLCAAGGKLRWTYRSTNLSSTTTATHLLDPPDTWVVTAGAAGMKIYKNGVAFGSNATPITRVSNTT